MFHDLPDKLWLGTWLKFYFSKKYLAPYIPTPIHVIQDILKTIPLKDNDVVYDLGSGDGRTLIEIAKLNPTITGYGYEIDKELCQIAKQHIHHFKFENRLHILQQDIMESNLKNATIVFLYLSEKGNQTLTQKLQSEFHGIVCSYYFPLFPNSECHHTSKDNVPFYLHHLGQKKE